MQGALVPRLLGRVVGVHRRCQCAPALSVRAHTGSAANTALLGSNVRFCRHVVRAEAAKQEVETVEKQKQTGPPTAAEETDSTPDSSSTQEPPEEASAQPAKASQEQKPAVEDAGRYPERTTLTGGWAGGEQGLQAFVQEYKQEAAQQPQGTAPKKAKSSKLASEETDPQKFPSKESIGGLDGITGGFVGGEKGVQQFVEKGDIMLSEPGARSRQFSILAIASVVAIAGTVGGILLTRVTDVGENVVKELDALKAAPVDDKTKLLLELALVLIGLTVTVAGGRAVLKNATGRLREQAVNLASLTAFVVGLYIAARFVLESS